MLWRRQAPQCSQRRTTIANPDYPHHAWHNKKAKLEEKDARSLSRREGTKVNRVKYTGVFSLVAAHCCSNILPIARKAM